MAREYFTRKSEWFVEYYDDTFTRDFAARTVFEDDASYDTGMLDAAGNKIMAREKKNPIGFVWPVDRKVNHT